MTRLARSQMLEVVRSDYVVTARAKGIPERRILYSHALPNALIPIVTYIGSNFGRALGGTVVIETVFSIPGIGYYMVKAVGNRDYPIIRGGVTMLALLFCLVVLIVDIFYAYIDPRIKAQYENSGKKRIRKTPKEATVNV
jgi:peptide/nickel transport system permease protein